MARSSASGIWKFISDSFLELGSSTLALALISDGGSGFCLEALPGLLLRVEEQS